jgi:hypothetical protein
MVWRDKKVASVTKQSVQAVAVRSRKRHASEVDQRDWDYRVRLPRDKRVADARSPVTGAPGPDQAFSYDLTDPAPVRTGPTWGSVTDTGSMEPIPDAVAWSAKADAWSQRSPASPDSTGRWDEPANRWSEVAATERPAFPPEGVGWRSETAEWRSSTDTATWRTTTEWRSTEGNSGWRSTTEAWQTGGNSEGARPPVEPQTRQPAISGIAWPTPSSDEQPWSTQAATGPPWQQQSDAAPRQQQAPEARPSWQTPAEPTQPWQQGRSTGPSWQQGQESSAAWQQESRPPWQQPAPAAPAPGPSWQTPAAAPPPAPSWQTPAAAPSWQTPAAAPPPAPSWQTPAAAPSWQTPATPPPAWQQPADEPPYRAASAAASAPTWQQPADSRPSWQQPPADPAPSWQQSGEAPPYWQSEPERRPNNGRPSWQPGIAATPAGHPGDAPTDPYGGAWSTTGAFDDGRHLVREDDRAQRRRESAAGMHDEASWRGGRRRTPDMDETRGGGTGWTVRSDSDNWAGHTDTGNLPIYQDPAARGESSWRREVTDTASWRHDQDSWRHDRAQSDPYESERARQGGRRDEPDSGSWARADEARTDTGSWRRSAAQSEAPTWRGAPDRDGDSGSWRRGADREAASDPWARGVADTGVGDWQPASDTGSWRTPPDPDDDWRAADDRPRGGRRSVEFDELDDRDAGPRSAPDDEIEQPARQQTPPEVRRQAPEAGAWRREQADRGAASYREGHTEDWRRELAAETGMIAGESRRFGTSDFPPFRPPGTVASAKGTAGSAAVAARSAPAAEPVGDPRRREDLLVGSRSGGGGSTNWQGPPDTQWPPRGSTGGYQRSGGAVAGPYERRPSGSMPGPSGRQLLDESDDDLEETTGGPLAAVGFTALWYGVPVVLFVLYMLVLDGTQQSHALTTLAAGTPQFGLSLVLSMAVAVGLRRASGSWKSASVGLAAAVVGGGLATVLMSAVTGQSLS